MTWMELILRMLLCLLIAGVIGGIIGWLLRRLFAEKNNAALEEAWQGRLASKEREWDLLRAESRKQLAATENQLSECNAGVQTHLATIADHEAKYAALQTSFDAKTTALDDLAAEAAALKEKLARAEATATDWQGKFTTADTSLTSKQSELGDLATKLAAATALTATLKGGSDDADKFKAENALLRQRLSSLESDLATTREWEAKHKAVLGERTALQQQLSALQATRKSEQEALQARLSGLETDLTKAEEWQAKYQTLASERDALQSASEARAGELVALQSKLNASDAARTELQAQHNALEASLSQQQSAADDLTTKLAAAAALATQLQDRTSAGEKLTAENNELRARLAALDTQLADAKEWQGKYTALAGERDQLQRQLGNLQATSHAQASDWEKKALAAAGEKDREIQELQKRVRELEPQAKDWEVKYLAVLDEKQRESQTLRNRVAELEPLGGLLSAMQAEAKTKDTHIHTLEARVKDLEAAVVPDLEAIEGIGPVYFKKLSTLAGISWQKELLARGKTLAGRREIVEQTGINDQLVLRWVNHCDLRRVNGVTEQYAELLEAAGVDSVPELAQRNPDNLHAKVVATNEAKHVSPATPSAEDIQHWIEQAKTLPRVVTH